LTTLTWDLDDVPERKKRTFHFEYTFNIQEKGKIKNRATAPTPGADASNVKKKKKRGEFSGAGLRQLAFLSPRGKEKLGVTTITKRNDYQLVRTKGHAPRPTVINYKKTRNQNYKIKGTLYRATR